MVTSPGTQAQRTHPSLASVTSRSSAYAAGTNHRAASQYGPAALALALAFAFAFAGGGSAGPAASAFLLAFAFASRGSCVVVLDPAPPPPAAAAAAPQNTDTSARNSRGSHASRNAESVAAWTTPRRKLTAGATSAAASTIAHSTRSGNAA